MKAADIMTKKLVTINSLATITEAARVMTQHNLRALIVERTCDQDAYGIITETDIAQAIAQTHNPEAIYVCQVMTKPCIVVNPDLGVEHIAKLFARAKIRIAPVIKDELLGIVSLTDILTKTNCLIPLQDQSTSQKLEQLTELPLDEARATELETIADHIYENWCSG